MKNQGLKILVIGAGGIGGITAAHISKAGFNIEAVDSLPGYAEKISHEGIHVFGRSREFRERMPAFRDIGLVSEKKDIIIIATKANALEAVMKAIRPLLKEETAIVSLQNSMSVESLTAQMGSHRVIGCVVGWGATAHAPGELERTSSGRFEIGGINGHRAKHFDFVKEMLGTTAPVTVTDNIYGNLYSKLIINSCITTLGAISGMTLGRMICYRKARNIFIEVIREAVNVGRAAGVSFPKYAGKLDFCSFADDTSLTGRLRSHLLIGMVGLKYWKLRSSGLQSLESGQKTEVDFLNGFISQKARSLHLSTPVNDVLIRLVHEIEDGKRSITEKNLELTFFNKYQYSL
ncbi:MAG: 2-dehydropantoate 2-reductase [Bacteroidales bacterium]|nr:2-dehydropantoate 2-reductase [Bacteroidales bacterium]